MVLTDRKQGFFLMNVDTYREDAVVSRGEVAERRHHARHRVNLEALVFVVLKLVGHGGVRALVVVTGHHPAHFLFARPVALLQQLDVEEFVGELGPVVVGVQHSDHNGGGGTQRWGAVIGNNDLETKTRKPMIDFIQSLEKCRTTGRTFFLLLYCLCITRHRFCVPWY